MTRELHNRSFLKELDFTPEEWRLLLALSSELKAAKVRGGERPRLVGKNIALIFEKASSYDCTRSIESPPSPPPALQHDR